MLLVLQCLCFKNFKVIYVSTGFYAFIEICKMEIEITKRSKTRQRNKKVFRTTVQTVLKTYREKIEKEKEEKEETRKKWEK